MRKIWQIVFIIFVGSCLFMSGAVQGQEKISVVKVSLELETRNATGEVERKRVDIKEGAKIPVNFSALVVEFNGSHAYTVYASSKPKIPFYQLSLEENAKYKLSDLCPTNKVYRLILEKPLKYDRAYEIKIYGNADGPTKPAHIVPFVLRLMTEPSPSPSPSPAS